jgi:glycosyltransferase involved in cell wall biosynthesis
MNREVVKQLVRLGVNVRTEIMHSGRRCFELNIPEIESLGGTAVPEGSPRIYGCLAPGFLPAGKSKNIVFTMMETETISPTYVQKCNCANEIWVPCEWNMQSFKNAGVRRNLVKIPLGVDPDLYTPVGEREFETTGFVFLSLFGWSLRKGPDILIKSFLKAFGDDPNYKLAIASRIWGNTDQSSVDQIRSEIEVYKKQAGYPGATNVFHLSEGYPEDQLPKLFRSADCFVLPSRGEGFGLPYIEAAACGVPVIATKHGGQLEFLCDETATLFEIEGYEPCKNLRLDKISSYYSNDVQIAKLNGNTVEKLANSMKDVVTNYPAAKDKANKLRQRILDQFTWEASAHRIIHRLNEL